MEFLNMLLQAVIIAAVPVVAAFAAKLLQAKAEESRVYGSAYTLNHFTEQALSAAKNVMLHTSQTYVDKLKEIGAFSPQNQREALFMAKQAAQAMLSREAIEFLYAKFGDVSSYLETIIEAEIKKSEDKNGDQKDADPAFRPA
jgi:hypothetical protein